MTRKRQMVRGWSIPDPNTCLLLLGWEGARIPSPCTGHPVPPWRAAWASLLTQLLTSPSVPPAPQCGHLPGVPPRCAAQDGTWLAALG